MRITNFTVSFKRSKQPASYESAEPFVSVSGVVDDDEQDPEGRIRAAMLGTVRVVYNTLAMDVPTGIVEKLTDVDPSDTNAPVEIAAKRGRGRPRKTPETSAEEFTPPSADLASREADAKAGEPAAPAVEPITDAKLMSFVTKVSGKLGAKAVKAKLAEMEVSRVGEMDQNQRRKFIADLEHVMEGDKA
jgi:hypothetical protein